MSARRGHAERPFSLDEIIAIVEVYEVLHGQKLARQKIKEWSADKLFTEEAYSYVDRYIENAYPKRSK